MQSTENKYNPYLELSDSNPQLCKQYKEIWEKIFLCLKESNQLEDVALSTWFKEIYVVGVTKTVISLFIPNDFCRTTIKARFLGPLADCAVAVMGGGFTVHVLEEGEKPERSEQPQPMLSGAYENDYEYTFDTFIVGNSNRFAHAAAIAVANNPVTTYNPLFIYGGSGLGKTHLLYAIMNKTRENNPNAKIVYLKGDDFTNELIAAIQNAKQMEFRNKYRFADLFLVDDIQFIAGKESTQDEFFHTFNSLYEAKKQIVLTSDQPPNSIAKLEERLRTRFEWGLLADIQPPDFETRMAIIKRKATYLNVNLPEEVITMLAERVKTNIRQLEGIVKKLKAYHQFDGVDITPALAERVIVDVTGPDTKIISPEAVVDQVARYYNMTSADLLGKKRNSDVVLPRHIAMYIIRETIDLSFPAIGRLFGGRDHTTVINAFNKVDNEMKDNPVFKSHINEIIKNIREN